MEMVLYFKSTDALKILPEPDPDVAPIATTDGQAVFSIVRELGPWVRVKRTDQVSPPQEGWVLKDKLQSMETSDLKPVKLYREPMGSVSDSFEARILQEMLHLDPWIKVLVQKADGSTAKGWMEPANERPDPNTATANDDLDLGANEPYRAALIKAQHKTGIDAAALAALVDAEAGKISTGPRKGQWNPDALNQGSGAAGLTQFLRSTWLDHAMKPGTELNDRARQDGMISAAGSLVAGREEPLLQLRFDPTLAILSAAEYGSANLKGLIRKGLAKETDTDDRKAELMYLAHHEGLGGAIGFLDRTKSYTFENLKGQTGEVASALVAQAGGDANAAYRSWLTGYIARKIVLTRFRKAGGNGGQDQTEQDQTEPATVVTVTGAGNPGTEQVQAYAGLSETTSLALKSYDGPAIAFPAIGGEPGLARHVQEALSVHGYLDPPADGEFGPVSIWALTQFTRKAGLSIENGLTPELTTLLADPATGLPVIQLTGQWIDRAVRFMQTRGHFINRHPDCCNIIYLEGVSPDGALNDDRPNSFNDLRIVFQVTDTGEIEFTAWEATTEPGDFWTFNPMNPKGAARIAFGQYKSWSVGKHLAGKPSGHEALVQVKPVTVHRDFNQDHKRSGDAVDHGIFGVNQHWGYDAAVNDIKNTSAGCLVGRARDGHREFMALIKSDARFKTSKGYRFVTAVLPGDRL
jgi:hypothetical protein